MFSARTLSHGFQGFALAAALGIAAQAHADTLYSQPFVETAAGGWWASQPGQFMQFDTFTLSSNATVNSVTWYGVDLNELISASPVSPTEFVINLYANNAAGQPGALLNTTTVDTSAGGATTGQQSIGLTVFQYTATLDASFHAVAGTTYWITIADSTLTNGNWFWVGSQANDNAHGTLVSGAWSTHEDDLAFSLQGVSAVPEPASAMLMLAGLLGVAALRRKN